MHLLKFLTVLVCLFGCISTSNAQTLECNDAERFEHTFDSGANWRFCASLDRQHGLELQQIHYQAPGDISRQVLTHLHLGQVLLHYHDRTTANALIGESGLGGRALVTLNERLCEGDLHTLPGSEANGTEPHLCSYVRDTGLMAKYNLRPGLQGQQYRLFAVSEYQGLTFQVLIGLSEDGRIAPSVTLSGRPTATTNDRRFGNEITNPLNKESLISTHASVLYTWRMAFSLNDNEQNDSVEEYNFMLEPSLGSRRPMIVTGLSTETLRDKERNLFRGWRIKDINGSGYYLDPQNSGYGYSDRKNNWVQFDIALTAFNDCERHSRIDVLEGNVTASISGLDIGNECNGSLDDFVNGESMAGRNPVLWYSMTRVFRPKAEDFPIISSTQVEFEIIPFDWTPTSPFEVLK